MAVSSKALCVVCNMGKGSFICGGCSQTFCPKHSNDHRNELSKQFEEIEVAHNLVKETFNQQAQDPRPLQLLKKVDEWEQTAIMMIRQTAEEVRNEVIKYTTEHTNNIIQKLEDLSNELRQGRQDNDFIETDLQQWIQTLNELKKELFNPATISIQEDSAPFLGKLRINRSDVSDIFERVCGNAQIREHGYLVIGLGEHTEVRGKREYSTGKQTLHFQIERFPETGWIFFGIISKSVGMSNYSYWSPSSYGWSNQNEIYVGSNSQFGQTLEILPNDTIILIIDCDQRRIQLKNKRLDRTIDLSVDINKCPFPWQLHLNLHEPDTQVHILNSFL